MLNNAIPISQGLIKRNKNRKMLKNHLEEKKKESNIVLLCWGHISYIFTFAYLQFRTCLVPQFPVNKIDDGVLPFLFLESRGLFHDFLAQAS